MNPASIKYLIQTKLKEYKINKSPKLRDEILKYISLYKDAKNILEKRKFKKRFGN